MCTKTVAGKQLFSSPWFNNCLQNAIFLPVSVQPMKIIGVMSNHKSAMQSQKPSPSIPRP